MTVVTEFKSTGFVNMANQLANSGLSDQAQEVVSIVLQDLRHLITANARRIRVVPNEERRLTLQLAYRFIREAASRHERLLAPTIVQ